jgi:hypothetical protein
VKNIAFDHGGAVQLDAICMDGPLDLPTDGQLLIPFLHRVHVFEKNLSNGRPQLNEFNMAASVAATI